MAQDLEENSDKLAKEAPNEALEEVEECMPFEIIEEMPEFPGGEVALMRYLTKIKWPRIESTDYIVSTIYVQFVIERDGSVKEAEALRGSDSILSEAAVKHILQMPKWTPGRQRGKAVRVSYVIPLRISFS